MNEVDLPSKSFYLLPSLNFLHSSYIHVSFFSCYMYVSSFFFISDLVRITLEEDLALRGFTPLMCNDQQTVYTYEGIDMVS